MAIAFPGLTPSSRNITAPIWPTTSSTSQSGIKSKRLWGSKPSQLTLALSFDNISDANATQILAAYQSTKSGVLELDVPSEIYGGLSLDLLAWIDQNSIGSGMKWYFGEEPPTVESVAPGRSSVRVTLVAELRLT
jgi:hypothetical protein